jgi:hypothetical protein
MTKLQATWPRALRARRVIDSPVTKLSLKNPGGLEEEPPKTKMKEEILTLPLD